MEEKKLLYRPEVARLFGVTDETISNYISYGILKAVKMSSRVYITRESVERVLTDLRSDDEIMAQGGLSVAGGCRCLTKDGNTSIEKEGYIPYPLQA